MELQYSKASLKFLKNIDKNIRDRILIGIQGILKIPPIGDIKQLQGYKNLYRLRIGKYRILYSCSENAINIDDIGSRGDIYK